MTDRDPHQYVKSFQATPFPSAGPLHTYTLSQLEFFEDDHDLHPEIDASVHQLFDKSAIAEVECYWINKKKLKWEYEELQQVQHDIWKRKLTLGGCAWHMAGAQILQCIKVVNRAKMWILMDEYKACRHGRRSWEGGNVTFRLDFTHHTDTLDCSFSHSSYLLSSKPMYNTDLAQRLCMIQSADLLPCMILSCSSLL